MNKVKKNDESIYKPYYKSDFGTLWYNEQYNSLETFKVIRPLTKEDKAVYDYQEDMYLIENKQGKQFEVYDYEILEHDFSKEEWSNTLIRIADGLEYRDSEVLDSLVRVCKIEKFIQKYY